MRDKFIRMTPELYEYIVEHGARQDPVLQAVERENESLGSVAAMQIAPEQGALLTLLVRSIGARRALEVGTFTGYSAICIGRGLPSDGELLCCEIDAQRARAARRNLEAAGLDGRVEIRIAPALETLRSLPDQEVFDFGFVDADKPGYPRYYEQILARLRAGGLLVLDNVLLAGRVLAPAEDDDSARAMHELNEALAVDERVDSAMLGVADGLTILRKR